MLSTNSFYTFSDIELDSCAEFGCSLDEQHSMTNDPEAQLKTDFVASLSRFKPESVQWTKFNKAALLKAVAKEKFEDREDLIEEFQDNWNEGERSI
jgi:hypothetical protein